MPVASKPKAGRAQRLPVVDADEAFELAADAILHRCSKSGHVNPSTEPPSSSTTNDLELHVATECDSSTAEGTNDCGSLVSDAAFRCRVSAVLVAIVCLSVLVLVSLRGNNVNEAGVPPATRAAAGAARSAPSPPASPPSSPQRTDLGSAQHLPPLPPSWRPSTPPSQPPLMPQPSPLEPSSPPLIPPTLPPPLSPRAPAPSPSATALRLAAGNVLHGQVTIGSSGTVLTAREDNAEGAIWSMCEQSRRGAPAGWEVGCGQCGGLGYEFKGDFDWNAPAHSADVASPPDGLASPVVKRLIEVLQGDYSLRLYGARGRIPPNLRLIWLQLLDNQTLASLPHVCVCVAKPPLAPFYYPQAEIFNPLDAIWVHTHDYGGASQATQGRSGAGVPNSTAVPDHGWVEVTHCPDTWSPTWFFAAPGSGLSLNVGKTHVLYHTRERGEPGVAGDADEEDEEGFQTHYNEATPRWKVPDKRWYIRLRLAGFDSVQFVRHKENFSPEIKHEILMLRWIRPALHRLRCGRHPWETPCTEDHAAVRMSRKCASGQSTFLDRRVREHAKLAAC